MQNIRVFLALCACLFSFSATAQFTVQSDTDYFTKTSPWIQYIYPREREGALPEVDHYMQFFRGKYEQSFKWKLDERVKMALMSNHNQMPNGFAMHSPFLTTIHFPAGTALMDLFAEDSFLFALASHETAHLYQLTPKSQLSSIVKMVLGNTQFVFTPLVIPIFVFPNAFLPGFMLEGNAMMNESTVGRGGRLWSGEIRSEVLAQVRGGKSGPSRLLNQQNDYPRSEDYNYGGYFMAFLAEKFGVEKTNQFYLSHANREFWPFNLNKTFRAHFKVSYTRLIHDFSLWLKPLADQHRPAQGQTLAHVYARPRFNHDDKHIFFVGSSDGKGSNSLYRMNRSDLKLVEESSDLPDAKTFLIDNNYYSVSTEMIDATHLRYALYGEGLAPKPGTEDMIYQDVRGGHTLVADATHAFERNSLVKDGQFLDHTAGSAVLDNSGRAYYFRQAGDEHVLYRDRDPLFKYKGYYGFPQEIGPNGEVYFIAATPFGATLFSWHNNQITRVFSADNIVEARRVNETTFLVAANDSNGFQLQLLKPDPRPELPAWFNYKLPNVMPPLLAAEEKHPSLEGEEKEYGAFSQLRYSQADIAWAGGGDGALSVLFADPLLWNTLFLTGAISDGDSGFAIDYRNKRHRLGYGITGIYQSEEVIRSASNIDHETEADVFLALDYRLFQWRRWTSDFRVGPTWKEESKLAYDFQRRYGVEAQWVFNYVRLDGSLAYEPYRFMETVLRHRTEASQRTNEKVDSVNGIESTVSADIFHQTFLRLSGAYAVAETDSIGVQYLKSQMLTNYVIPTYLDDGDVQEVREFSAQLKQVIDWSYYFPRFPLSLRRLAPFVSFKDTYTHQVLETSKFPTWRQELGIGTELEMLLLNSYLLRFAPSFSTIKLGGGDTMTDWRGVLSLKKAF